MTDYWPLLVIGVVLFFLWTLCAMSKKAEGRMSEGKLGEFYCQDCSGKGWQEVTAQTPVVPHHAPKRTYYIPVCACGRISDASTTTEYLDDNPKLMRLNDRRAG